MTADIDWKGSLHGVPVCPPSAGGVVRVLYKGKVWPILFDAGSDIDAGIYSMLRQMGENAFFNDGSEHELPYDSVFYAANAGGLIGRRRRRFEVRLLTQPSLQSIKPSYREFGETPEPPQFELVEIDPA